MKAKVSTLNQGRNCPTNGGHLCFPVFYGDIADPRVLSALHAEQAALIVLTVDKEHTALQAVSHIRSSYPGISIIARARDLESSGRLVQAGATRAMPEALESSLRLAHDTLTMLGMPADNVNDILADVRKKNYKLIDS